MLLDNAAVHSAEIIQTAVNGSGFEQNNHPSYSPDIVLTDNYLSKNLKNDHRRYHSSENEEKKATVWPHFDSKSKEYFLRVLKCNKCSEGRIALKIKI